MFIWCIANVLYVMCNIRCWEECNIIPRPVSAKILPGIFSFHEKVKIFIPKNDSLISSIATTLNTIFVDHTGISFRILEYEDNSTVSEEFCIVFKYNLSIFYKEGYRLNITSKRIIIEGSHPNGMYHAVTSLRQMFPPFMSEIELEFCSKQVVSVKCAEIEDYPRYPYRGLMLDVSRHFLTIEDVKRFIDLLAFHKMNILHFHLTDDQGWRIFIKKYPKLTEIGAWRVSQNLNSLNLNGDNELEQGFISGNENGCYITENVNSTEHTEQNAANDMYGGFYTTEDIKEIVDYAEKCFIQIIPEIEIPGHAVAAVASYPWLSCEEKSVRVQTDWGIFTPVFCSKEEVMVFLEDVVKEVMELFPSPLIHIGGDECPTTDWEKCKKCKARMEEENLTNVSHLQGVFVRRMQKVASEKNRKVIGWEEISEAGVNVTDIVLMMWRSTLSIENVVNKGVDVILAPVSPCYFDYQEGSSDNSENDQNEKIQNEKISLNFSGQEEASVRFNSAMGKAKRRRHNGPSLASVYRFDPLSYVRMNHTQNFEGQNRSENDYNEVKKHVLGGQANLWSEHLLHQSDCEWNTFPRLAAMCEALWTPSEKKDYHSFRGRLSNSLVLHYKSMKVNYNPISVLNAT